MTLHLITTNDIKVNGHYLTHLFLPESQDVTMRKIDDATMVKCPDGSYVEIFPHEYDALKHHKIIWEEEEMKNFKVIIKTNQKNCPYRHRPYLAPVSDTKCTELLDCETGQFLPCSAKNCPFKEGK